MISQVLTVFLFTALPLFILYFASQSDEVLFWQEGDKVNAKITTKLLNSKVLKEKIVTNVHKAIIQESTTSDNLSSYDINLLYAEGLNIYLYTVKTDFDREVNAINEKIHLVKTGGKSQLFKKPFRIMAVIFATIFLLMMIAFGIGVAFP